MSRADVFVGGAAPGPDAEFTVQSPDERGRYWLVCERKAIAHSTDPRRLSDWAFEHHAKSVRHDYRCDLVEARIARGEL